MVDHSLSDGAEGDERQITDKRAAYFVGSNFDYTGQQSRRVSSPFLYHSLKPA